ncbi:MAG: phosphoglycerate kinase [Clostridia bacterium]|jgi:3-phosphoglycerate kinase
MKTKTIEDFNVKDKRVLVRVDFNVPQDDNGNITDDNRIMEALPTIKYLISKDAKVILCSHLGRPIGFDKKFSLLPVQKRLSQILKTDIAFADDVAGPDSVQKANELKSGEILLLENLRFMHEEEENNTEFSKKLASLADIYINDAFGSAHRKHSSTYGVAEFLPSGAGFLMAKEIEMLSTAITNPKRPLIAILGGAKVSEKIGVIKNLLENVNTLIIGGAMAYTFLKAQGVNVGNSLVDDNNIKFAISMIAKAQENNVNLLLPIDHIVAKELNKDSKSIVTIGAEIPQNLMGMDIGPKTVKLYKQAIKNGKTIIWNGPLGVFEIKQYCEGTKAILKAVVASGANSIIGGGDTASAVINLGYKNKVTHISTGGGASLKLLEGARLPGIEKLQNK